MQDWLKTDNSHNTASTLQLERLAICRWHMLIVTSACVNQHYNNIPAMCMCSVLYGLPWSGCLCNIRPYLPVPSSAFACILTRTELSLWPLSKLYNFCTVPCICMDSISILLPQRSLGELFPQTADASLLFHLLRILHQAVFRGQKIPTSRGCVRCVLLGGRNMKQILFCSHISTT